MSVHHAIELVRIFLRRNEGKYAAVYIFCVAFFQLFADVARYGLNVAHHHVHIGKYNVVYALQYVIGLVLFCRDDTEGVVDESFAQWLDFADCTLDVKKGNDVCQFFFFHDV